MAESEALAKFRNSVGQAIDHVCAAAERYVKASQVPCSECESLSPNPDDAPACCGGELMLPYRISSQEDLDVKIVSRWIDDIEKRDADAVYDEVAAAARDTAGL